MDGATYFLRPFTDADFELESRIWSESNPEQPISAEELRHYDHLLDAPGYFKHYLVTEERRTGRGVAVGSMFNAPWAYDPDRYWVSVAVDRAHQGRGIARELYRTFDELASARRAKALWASVRAADLRGVKFFERCGFIEQRRAWVSRLDLASVHLSESPEDQRARWAAEGVQFTTLAAEGPDLPEVRERLYQIDTRAGKDSPRMGPVSSFSFQQFVDLTFHGPGFLPDGVFLARVGNEYVAMTLLERLPTEPDTLHIGFTGTLREYRGRGLATELKRRSIEYARSQGFRFLRTGNDSMNPAIWAINNKLGFRVEQVWVQGEKELVRPG